MDRLLELVKRAFAPVPEAAAFLADWPAVTERREIVAGTLPVCDWIPELQAETGPVDTAVVVAQLQQVAADLSWRQTYGAGDFGAAFLRGYGWSEFIGLRGPVPSARIACGVLLLAPGISYPSHAHAAEEVYLPISGVAEWQMGVGAFVQVPVGQAIHHPSWTPHAMRSGDQPLAALYLWRGGDLAAKSVIL
ncbi:dimethylsulfonioproprionate lyase family protein [Cypionkella sp. TWP1-2-1b2]|uniref:dimethylsulfonioproprionate lyase family protein n=1 Tax=Cypionkella sp. TWP1-2-1b2 TaxID=2804675 RepID=UPI003CF4A1E5